MRPYSLFLIGCLSLPAVALADDDKKSGDAESESASSLKYKADRGVILKVNDDISFRFDAFAQVEGTNDPDVVDVQGSPVIPRRLKLSLRGRVTDYVSMKLAVDLAPLLDLGAANAAANDDDGEVLNDAYLQGNVSDKFFVRAGYTKTPFGRQRTNSSAALLMPNRSVATGKFTFDRGVGGLVGGELSKESGDKKSSFEYQAGVTADLVLANLLNVDAVPVGVVRLVANPLGSLKDDEGALKPVDELHVSVGLNAGVPFASSNDTGNPVVGLDAAFEVGRVFGLTEFFARARQTETPTIDANGDVIAAVADGNTQLQAGGFFQAGALIVPERVQLAGRFGVVGADPDFSDGNNNGKFNQQGLKTETSAGVNGFIFERRLMLQGMFSHLTEQGDNNENIVTFQLQGSL